MKRIILLLLGLIVLASCEQRKENEYRIQASVSKELNGRNVVLRKVERNQYVEVDTSKITNGKFSFKGFSEFPELHYLFIDEISTPIGVVLEEGTIKVSAHKDSIPLAKMGGTISNDEYYTFVKEQRKINIAISEIRIEYNNAAKEGDTVTIQSLSELYQETIAEAQKFEPRFMENNPTSYVTLLLLERMYGGQLKTTTEAKEIFDKFPENIQKTNVGVTLGTALIEILAAEKNTSIGSIAPDFSAPTPSGELLKLSDVRGKITIVDFWAAWCKPCRVENPNIVAMYNKYHDKGLNIIGVSLDGKQSAWLQAIEEDKLPWNHVSNLQSWQDPIAKSYNVRAIPATFILDEEGKIVARDLRGPALEAKVGELLGAL